MRTPMPDLHTTGVHCKALNGDRDVDARLAIYVNALENYIAEVLREAELNEYRASRELDGAGREVD